MLPTSPFICVSIILAPIGKNVESQQVQLALMKRSVEVLTSIDTLVLLQIPVRFFRSKWHTYSSLRWNTRVGRLFKHPQTEKRRRIVEHPERYLARTLAVSLRKGLKLCFIFSLQNIKPDWSWKAHLSSTYCLHYWRFLCVWWWHRQKRNKQSNWKTWRKLGLEQSWRFEQGQIWAQCRFRWNWCYSFWRAW